MQSTQIQGEYIWYSTVQYTQSSQGEMDNRPIPGQGDIDAIDAIGPRCRVGAVWSAARTECAPILPASNWHYVGYIQLAARQDTHASIGSYAKQWTSRNHSPLGKRALPFWEKSGTSPFCVIQGSYRTVHAAGLLEIPAREMAVHAGRVRRQMVVRRLELKDGCQKMDGGACR